MIFFVATYNIFYITNPGTAHNTSHFPSGKIRTYRVLIRRLFMGASPKPRARLKNRGHLFISEYSYPLGIIAFPIKGSYSKISNN